MGPNSVNCLGDLGLYVRTLWEPLCRLTIIVIQIHCYHYHIILSLSLSLSLSLLHNEDDVTPTNMQDIRG